MGLRSAMALPRAKWRARQRLAEVAPPVMPSIGEEPAAVRSRANPLGLYHFRPNMILTADDLNRFVDALLALDERLAAIEARLHMPVKG